MFTEHLKRKQLKLPTIVLQVPGHMRCIYNVKHSSIVGKKGSILQSQSSVCDSVAVDSFVCILFLPKRNHLPVSSRKKASTQIILHINFLPKIVLLFSLQLTHNLYSDLSTFPKGHVKYEVYLCIIGASDLKQSIMTYDFWSLANMVSYEPPWVFQLLWSYKVLK